MFGGLARQEIQWNGYVRNDFMHKGRKCIVVAPKTLADGKPWVWRARFFGHEPQADIALLKLGFHVAYCDVSNLFGNPVAVQHWNDFYKLMTTEHGFAKRPALEGMSRGGLIIYNWAAANPDKVACLYGDAPVCDFKSWPGGKGKGKGSPGAWRDCQKAYGLSETEALAFRGNPIDNLKPLAEAKVPILHVVGAADVVVPVAENSALIEARYRKLGGDIRVISKPGIGHHPHALKDPKPIVDFIVKHAAPKKKSEPESAAFDKKAPESTAAKHVSIDPKTTYHRSETLEVWANRLQSENDNIRLITAAKLDGEGPSPPYLIPQLLSLASDRNPRVARYAIAALAQLDQYSELIRPVLQPIAETAQHPNQAYAIEALGKLAFKSAKPDPAFLRKMLLSADVTSRNLAATGLWKLEGKPQYLEVIFDDTCRLKTCRRRGVVLSLSHFAAAEPKFVPACERFLKRNPSRSKYESEWLLVAEVKRRAAPLIVAQKARLASQPRD